MAYCDKPAKRAKRKCNGCNVAILAGHYKCVHCTEYYLCCACEPKLFGLHFDACHKSVNVPDQMKPKKKTKTGAFTTALNDLSGSSGETPSNNIGKQSTFSSLFSRTNIIIYFKLFTVLSLNFGSGYDFN